MHVCMCVKYEKARNSHITNNWWNSNSMKNWILSSDGFFVVEEDEKLAPAQLLQLVLKESLEQRL